MNAGNSTYKIGIQQYEQALDILEKEQKNLRPSRLQDWIFRFFKIVVYGIGLVAGLSFLLFIFINVMKLIPESYIETALQINHEDIVKILIIFSLLLFIPTSLIIVILFFFNIPFLLKLWRYSMLVRKLGLSEIFEDLWKEEYKKLKFTNFLTVLAGSVGLLIMLLIVPPFLVDLANTDIEYWIAGGRLVLLFILVMCVALTAFYFMRRTYGRLEVINRLLTSLKEIKEIGLLQDSYLNIPAKAYEQIAQIERDQISRERMQSIISGLKEPESQYYFVQKSRDASLALAQLNPSLRLRVQQEIDALTSLPHSSHVFKDPESNILHLHVPETSIILDFEVNDDTRRIKVISIRPTNDKTTSILKE